jgi:Rrf2 family protein
VVIHQAAELLKPMKLSRKSDYALRALMTLVERFGKGPVSIRELAEKNDVPRGFLEHIMLDLKSQGVVRSIAGRIGGFVLARQPEEITMGEIVRHFDGLLAPIGCVSLSNYEPCSQEAVCRFRRVLLDIRNYTAHKMDKANLAEVFGSKPVTSDEVFSMVFIGGDGI